MTAADVQAKIAPVAGADVFSIGNGADDSLTAAALESIVLDVEAQVVSYLRDRYQVLMDQVPGEVVVEEAVEGQVAFVLGLTPVVAGSVKLWVNPRGAWRERRDLDALVNGFTLNVATGEVVLDVGLRRGDRVVAVYRHGFAPQVRALKALVVQMVAVEISRRFAYFRSADGFDRFEGWQSSAAGYLRDLSKQGAPAIPAFDQLKLVDASRPKNFADIFGKVV